MDRVYLLIKVLPANWLYSNLYRWSKST